MSASETTIDTDDLYDMANDIMREDADEQEFKPCPEDYTITPVGNLGGMYGVGQIEGKFLGQWCEWDDTILAIRDKMEEEKFWPSVWWVSDHGNWSVVNMTEQIKNAEANKAEEKS